MGRIEGQSRGYVGGGGLGDQPHDRFGVAGADVEPGLAREWAGGHADPDAVAAVHGVRGEVLCELVERGGGVVAAGEIDLALLDGVGREGLDEFAQGSLAAWVQALRRDEPEDERHRGE
jgi:hypothetical protein